jgi:hypothetical protein
MGEAKRRHEAAIEAAINGMTTAVTATRLYHTAKREHADGIMAEGFRDHATVNTRLTAILD